MPQKKSYLFSFFYNLAIFILVLCYLPKLLKRLFNKELPSIYFKQRLGFGLKEIKRKYKGAIWIHSVSLGETKAIAPLVTKLKEEYPSGCFLFSSSTTTGYNEAKKVYPNDGHLFLPVDLSFVIQPFVRAIKPKFILFTETDLWYHLVQASFNEKAYNIVVSAKLSERSEKNYNRLRMYGKKLFSYVHLFCCQNTLYKERLSAIGVPENKLKVTGNIKYDIYYPKKTEEQIEAFKKEMGIDECIVLGSTHQKEEEDLLERLPKDKTIVVVPRHPHRFEEVKQLLEKKGISFYRVSQKESRPETFHVILVDSMGMLLQFYEAAKLAIVCGSYQPIGGHNILEPLSYGTPVLFGPYMHTQFELVDLVLKAEAGMQVPLEDISRTVDDLFKHPEELKRMGENGKKLIDSLQGVAKRTLNEIHLLTLNRLL